ncbi:MAG: butyrate kinase [Eubacteriales bacterium]|nr:butyrate kinase [Eubacteriales bacterium]
MKLLVINIGSTSTKLAVYNDETPEFTHILRHPQEDLKPLRSVEDHYRYRKPLVEAAIKERGLENAHFDAVVGRGGLVKPIPSGTYAVNELMYNDLLSCKWGKHLVNLGGILAFEVAAEHACPAYIVDPVVVDEMEEVARLSGYPDMPRTVAWHALNQKAIAKGYAKSLGRKYEDMNLIVAHMGGGVTIGSHKKGRVIDVNNAIDGDGPYSAERPGGLPVGEVMRLCYSGKYPTYEDIRKEFTSRGGLVAYLGTNDMKEVAARVEAGDEYAKLILKGMAYQTAKDIGAAAAVLSGEVDAVIVTGGIAYNAVLMGWIKERVSFIAPFVVVPGEDELGALALGALRVLKGEEQAQEYAY